MIALLLLSVFALASAVPVPEASWVENCGQSKYPDAGVEPGAVPFIVGGRDARPHEFPWQTSIRRTSIFGESHFCGGFIVHPQWVVTAAHCMDGETIPSIRVVVGEHATNETSTIRQSLPIETYFMHERYGEPDGIQYDHDIAIIKLREPMTFTENIQPVCQPDRNNLYVNYTATVSGWGTMMHGTALYPNYLQVINIPIPSNAACDQAVGPGRVTENMICGGRIPEFQRDSCQGDSGGPMAVKIDDRFHVVGIVSWGFGCADGPPGVYARVSQYNDWVQSKIDKNR